jgi:hypothetical protein
MEGALGCLPHRTRGLRIADLLAVDSDRRAELTDLPDPHRLRLEIVRDEDFGRRRELPAEALDATAAEAPEIPFPCQEPN